MCSPDEVDSSGINAELHCNINNAAYFAFGPWVASVENAVASSADTLPS
jgi:hypothetical protein